MGNMQFAMGNLKWAMAMGNGQWAMGKFAIRNM